MSQKNKLSASSTKMWQRHALAKACALAIAGAGVVSSAGAVPVIPGAALLTSYGTDVIVAQMSGTYWSTGYNNQWRNIQTNSGSLMAPVAGATYFSDLTGAGGSYPVSITGNSILASVLGNQGTSTQTTLNRVSDSNDGVLSLNLQIFTGLVDNSGDPAYLGASSATATLDNTSKTSGTVYITQSGLDSANLSLSNNAMGASVTLNSLDTTVAVATPSGYESSSKGSSTLSFGATSNSMGAPATPTSGSTGSVNLSNQQGVFNATAAAEVKSVMANVTVSGTAGLTPTLSSSISANGNSITASTTNNAAVSVFRSTADSSAFTGTVGVTNLQSTTIVEASTAPQSATVTASGVAVDLRNGGVGVTQVTGPVTVNDNKLSASVSGNTAGAQSTSGNIAAGNAIIFEGGSNITGASTDRTTELAANIDSGTSNAKADLLINSVQRNVGNQFTATLGTSTSGNSIQSNLDNLKNGGSLTQSGNTLSASATNNLAGNLISAGQTGSIGNITASSVLLNTQKNDTVTTLAEVHGATVSATVGATDEIVSGAVTLSSNVISATAQGNLASSTLTLKADNLNVGANGASNGVQLTPATPTAVSGLAVSTLNVQTNNAQDLTALNQAGSVALTFTDGAAAVGINGTQATVNSNQLATTAAANTASNRISLESTNAAGLNAGLGSVQTNALGSTTASSGLSSSALTISMEAGGVQASQLSLSTNSITAQAQLNSVNNSLSSTQVTTSGVLISAPNAAGNLSSGNVTAFADMALANAQTNINTSADASSYGAMTVSTGALTAASTLQANSNQIAALADGNSASNALTLNNGSMSNMTAALVSGQLVNHTDITTQAAGEVSVTTAAVTASSIAVNDNTVKATSISNSSSNSLSVTATNATGAGLTITPAASSDLNNITLVADMTLLNSQKTTSSSAVQATAGVSGTPALIKLAAGAVSSSANLTLNGNAVAASAYANSANNTGTVAINTMTSMTAALGNVQVLSGGSLEATTYGAANANLSSIDGSNVSVNTNAITSAAMGNTATSSLSITASNASGRGAQPSFMSNGDTSADIALTNLQKLLDNTVVASTAGDVTLTSTGSVTGPANVSLNGNTVSAYASGSYATNDLAVVVNNLTNSSSALVSRQDGYRASTGSVITATATGTVALESAAVTSANLSMNGNTVKSTALDNVANNQLILSGTSATGKSSLLMTGLISPITASGEDTVVAADVSLINLQSSGGTVVAPLTANTGVADAVAISTSIAGVNAGATVTVNDNAISSLVFDNNATNTLGVNVTTLTAMTGALSNTQKIDKASLSATTVGGVNLTSTAAVDTASLTLKGNSIAATAGANEASSSFVVVATDVVGRNMGSRITNAGALAVAADFAVGNEQQVTDANAYLTAVKAASTGDVHLDVGSNTVTAGNVALSNNSLASYGSGNNASNLLSMTATNISQASLGIASKQSMEVMSYLTPFSAVTSTTTGSIKMTAGDAASSNLSATGNTIKSTALGNVASNTLMATASTYTGPAALEGPVGFAAGSEGTSTTADLAIANVQNNGSTAAISAVTSGSVQMALGNVNLTEGGAASSASLTGNTLKALAQSNSASNEIKLNITQFSAATAGVVSYQNSLADVSASLTPDGSSLFSITSGDVAGGSISVSGNTASALAGINEAFNTLTVSGANLLGRGSAVSSTVGVASSTGADFAVMNAQSASTSVAATVAVGTSGFSATGSFSGGSVAVTGNTVLARASANTANNALTLAASGGLDASGVVNNVQDMANATTVKATVNSSSAIGAEFASAPGNAVVTVQDNTVTAQATGNVANNALNATATSGIAAAGSSATSPTFAVLNYQTTGSSTATEANPSGYGIQSAINGITIGGTQMGGALNGGSASASANQLLSVAYGNSANNAVVVSSLAPGLNTASASITNVQYNMASVNAAITNSNVQASGSVGTSGGNINVTGNSMVAMAVGNRSVNSITGR